MLLENVANSEPLTSPFGSPYSPYEPLSPLRPLRSPLAPYEPLTSPLGSPLPVAALVFTPSNSAEDWAIAQRIEQ
eukprot:2067129-Rhodomonas_salina.3